MKSKYIRFFIAVLIGTTVFAFTGGCSGTSSKPENKLPSQQENVTLTVGKKDSVSEEEKRYGYRNGDVFLQQYRNNALVKQIILVETQEGDRRTPTGDYGMCMAFGAKEDPGSLVPYTKLTDTMYLCGDKEYYNQFIDVSKINHTCSNNSEHLIRYIPQYNYALFFDYNKENVYGKGSAIFLHCCGSYPYTLGCISVAEENMIKILKTVDKNARICIYPGK